MWNNGNMGMRPIFTLILGGALLLISQTLSFFGLFRSVDWLRVNAPSMFSLLSKPGFQETVLLAGLFMCAIGLFETFKPRGQRQDDSHQSPAITARWLFQVGQVYTQTGFQLMLHNNGPSIAVNVSALPMNFEMPDYYIARMKAINTEILEAYKDVIAGDISDYVEQVEKGWSVTFGCIDRLMPASEEQQLPCRISNMGPGQDISDILEHFIGQEVSTADHPLRCAQAVVPFTIIFSDTGTPMRTWHAHYALEFTYRAERKDRVIHSVFNGFGKVTGAACSRCPKL
jgi:hypothetical protein